MSQQLKQFESRKLFFSEYLYKLVLRNELNVIFRSELQKKEKLSYARQELDRLAENYRNNLPLQKKAWRADIQLDTHDYFDAMTIYTALKSSDEYKLRVDPRSLPLKVWFNSTRINKDFANWIRANSDKCKIGKIALEGLENYGYLNGLYIYLRDEKILNLVTLLAGNSIRNVEKLVYVPDIDK
jgi:hypothetical protein